MFKWSAGMVGEQDTTVWLKKEHQRWDTAVGFIVCSWESPWIQSTLAGVQNRLLVWTINERRQTQIFSELWRKKRPKLWKWMTVGLKCEENNSVSAVRPFLQLRRRKDKPGECRDRNWPVNVMTVITGVSHVGHARINGRLKWHKKSKAAFKINCYKLYNVIYRSYISSVWLSLDWQ